MWEAHFHAGGGDFLLYLDLIASQSAVWSILSFPLSSHSGERGLIDEIIVFVQKIKSSRVLS